VTGAVNNYFYQPDIRVISGRYQRGKGMAENVPELKRQWSILPVRALLDRKLTQSEFRVLAAMCVYTNSYGVCWPGTQTIGAILGMDQGNVSRAIQKLVRRGYVRRLMAKDYQLEYAKFGKINRYQVLYQPDAALPSWEEIQSSIVLAPVAEDGGAHINDMGSGDGNALASLSSTLAHAYCRAVQARTGQIRQVDNEINHARKLAERGATVEQVQAATVAACDAALARRAGVPSLADVARLV
jgi:hypothetical protein